MRLAWCLLVACGLLVGAGSARATAHRAPPRRHHHHASPHAPPATPLVTTARPALGTRSTGCGAARAQTGLTSVTLTVRSVERTFLLAVPASYDPATALPLVIAFHGRTGTPTSLRAYLHLEHAAAGGAVFVYPAGVRVPVAGSDRTVTRWDVGPDGADFAFFDAIVAHVTAAYCIDLGRVFAVGHSAGAEVTNEMGCQRGNVLRAIAPIAGMGPFSRRCTAPPSVWLTHGRADAPVPFHWGESSRDHWVAAAHCGPAPAEPSPDACQHFAGCITGVSVVFCPHDGDHGPPPFAAHAIWEFFGAQQ